MRENPRGIGKDVRGGAQGDGAGPFGESDAGGTGDVL